MRRSGCLLLAFAVALASAAAQEDFPSLPLEPFISKLVRKDRWTPPLPAGLQLMDHAAPAVVGLYRGKPAVYIETDYLKLISTVGPIRLTPFTAPRVRETLALMAKTYPALRKRMATLGRVELAHFFAVHLHRVMVECWRLFGTTTRTYEQYLKEYKHGPYMRWKNKFEVYLFGRTQDYLEFADRFVGRRSDDGQRWRNPVTDALALLLPPPRLGAKNLNNWVITVIHNWAHLVLMSEIRLSANVPVWLDVGFAHLMEQRESLDNHCYCFDEGARPVRFAGGDWRPEVRGRVVMRKAPELALFFDKQNLGELTGDEHGVSFGLVDYLVREKRDGFRRFVHLRFKNWTQSQREAFREAFGTSPSSLDEAWRAWARKSYSKQGLRKLAADPLAAAGG